MVSRDGESGCLICGSEVYSRGLCNAHFQVYRREVRSLAAEDQPLFEQDAIAAGLVLPAAKSGRKKIHENPFEAIASKYRRADAPAGEDQLKTVAEKPTDYATRKKKKASRKKTAPRKRKSSTKGTEESPGNQKDDAP